MTNEQKHALISMRESDVPIPAISAQLGISENTIKSYCKRHGIHSSNPSRRKILYCLQCHAEIPQTPKRKAKKFCCDKCRQLWWTAHSNLIHCISLVNHTCPVCGKTFQAYKSKHRTYCSRTCYGKSKEVTHE